MSGTERVVVAFISSLTEAMELNEDELESLTRSAEPLVRLTDSNLSHGEEKVVVSFVARDGAEEDLPPPPRAGVLLI